MDSEAQATGQGPIFAETALRGAGIPVLENAAVRLEKDGYPIWLAGLGDQLAFFPKGRPGRKNSLGVDDLAGTLAKISGDGPIILLAHEPDIFPAAAQQGVSLTLSGHTHGGQVRLFGWAPVKASRYGDRYIYGHVVENDRHLVVSGGLGVSGLPIRFGIPPEIVLLELGETSTS